MGSSVLVVVCAYPRKADDGAPDETVLTLFPDGYADGGVRGEPVYAHEDVRGGEVQPDIRQGLGVARIVCSGHCLGKQGFIPIPLIYLFLTGTELSDFMECLCPPISLLIYLAHNVLPFITHRTLPHLLPSLSSQSSTSHPPSPLFVLTHVLDSDLVCSLCPSTHPQAKPLHARQGTQAGGRALPPLPNHLKNVHGALALHLRPLPYCRCPQLVCPSGTGLPGKNLHARQGLPSERVWRLEDAFWR